VKIHDFGLWFEQYGKWSTTIPQAGSFFIWYDRELLGQCWGNLALKVWNDNPCKIQIRDSVPMVRARERGRGHYDLRRPLTLNDFEIIENPEYEPDG
jgi:transposase